MQKINNIIVLRFLAILSVVLGHSIIIYDHNWGIYNSTIPCKPFEILKEIINIYQMPIFFAISGFLFYNPNKNKSIKQIFYDKFKRLIIPYFSIALLWMDPIKFFLSVPGYDDIFKVIKDQILFNNNGHLWFLPTLFEIFIIFSFARISSINKKYQIILFFTLSLLLNKFSSNLPILSKAMYYQLFFITGYFIHKYFNHITINKFISLISIIILIILFLFLEISFIKTIITLSIISICLLSNIGNYSKFPIINNISNNSYGMYLFHSPLIYFTFALNPNLHPLIVLIINFIIFGYISYYITTKINKSKFKFILGLY